ncbi:hypothetical protein BJ165DRAFT_1441037 [Panaeolus papilionaceus]|nr:hypothetical protein BJ165DRAFT_1441037 [Panaeolus papilionaceus]
MSQKIIILDSDSRIVYNSLATTNDSSSEAWEHQTWSIDGNTGTFATTSSPSAFLSLQIQEPVIGLEYWGFLHNASGACLLRLQSSASSTDPKDEVGNVLTEGNAGPPVMLFSMQLSEPAVPSVFLANENAPVMDLVSFVFILPSSTVDGSLPTPTVPQESVSVLTSIVSLPTAPELSPTSPSPVEVLPTSPAAISITTASEQFSLSNSHSFPAIFSSSSTIGPPLGTSPGLPTSRGSNGTSLATALPAPAPSSHSSKSLAGKVAGGVVGGLAFLVLLGWLVYYRIKHQRKANESKAELDSPDSRQSIISSEASNVITPFPAIPRPDFVPAKFGGREMPSLPSLQPVRPVSYGVKPSQMRPASLPAREEGPSQPPMGVLPRAKHASLSRPPEAPSSGSSAPAPANVPADVNGLSLRAAQNMSGPMGPRRAVDGGPLVLPTEPPRNEVITASPPTY